MRKLQRTLAALALGALTGAASADDGKLAATGPVVASVDANQTLADRLADHLRASGKFRHYSVDIEVQDGVVTLGGLVASADQRRAMVELVSGCPGVQSVRDKLAVADSMKLVVANFGPADAPMNPPGGMPAGLGGERGAAPGIAPDGRLPEPAPSHTFAGGVMPYSDTPVMPPYSWPAYTPYNNFASMAYQTQYPSGAWPFIGPPHPYPMIPSGWRRVTLKWRGGYWWLKFHAH